MAEVQRLSEHRREYIPDGETSALRATWHRRSGRVVISLWRGETCVATSHLTPREAGRLATFITGGLAELADGNRPSDMPPTPISPRLPVRIRLRAAVAAWRDSVGWSVERIGRRLRPNRG